MSAHRLLTAQPQDLSEEALQAAKREAEATALKQLEAIAADTSQTDEARRKAKGAIKAQHAEMEVMAKQIEEAAKWVGILRLLLRRLDRRGCAYFEVAGDGGAARRDGGHGQADRGGGKVRK